MTCFSKEVTSQKQRLQTNDIALPEDTFFVVFDFSMFQTLCRVKTVCKWWMKKIDTAILFRVGRKQFITNKQLREAVRRYCFEKKYNSEELARTYGWPIGKWDVSQVTDFSYIFKHMRCFNEDISDWDVSNGTNFSFMFCEANCFNQDLSSWNVSQATSFWAMFLRATLFNLNWNTSHVTTMCFMFYQASSFNGNVSTWDTTNVLDMEFMFSNATSFN
eukprot:CAMPEP_0178917012 /NCGR_PEP_ID=MMETSP0786-20121207/12997_1 /TAXON_ID=186022 /ORGANISM="Thalassionema frauenfeldii, Strain CCMP 1798" /LENGTH=217 /DNA_ID=CAMNT_0020590489 /DNA_START=117 /DNA_END=767 /DNA_ORIENTATION=-